MNLALFAATAALLAATPAVAPAAAHTTDPRAGASSVVLRDGPGDVWTFSDSTSGYQLAAQPAADVLRARVTHGPYAVSVRLVFDDLQRRKLQWYYCDIHTTGVTSWYILQASNGQGTLYQDVEGEWVAVPRVTHHIDYASDVVTIRVPRTLLGGPPWVRVRLHNVLRLPDATFFTDNPTTSGPDADFTRRVPAPASGA